MERQLMTMRELMVLFHRTTDDADAWLTTVDNAEMLAITLYKVTRDA
jgi:hypothetical protein